MKKLKLLFATFALILGWSSASASTDITSTYLTNADLSVVDNGWTYYSDAFKYTDWKTDGDVPVVEFYSTWTGSPQSMDRKDFKFSQTVTMPAGYYRLAVNAFYRNGDGDGTNDNKAWIFVKGTGIDKSQNVAALTAAGVGGYTGSNDLYKAANAFSLGDFSNAFDFKLTESTQVEIGFQGFFNLTKSWCILGPVKLYEYTAEDYMGDYRTKVSEAEALYSSPMNATVLSNLKAAVVEEATLVTVDDVFSAVETLTAAISAANTSIVKYAEAKTILDAANGYDAAGQASYAANETIAAIQAGYDDGSLVSVSNDQKTAAQTALADACKAQVQPANNCDMTAYISNPNISGNVTGWTCDMNGNGGYVGGPLKPSGDAMEFWAAGTQTDQDHGKSFDYYQQISSLPTGAYTISAQMLNSTNGEEGADWAGGGKAGLYGKTTSNEVQKLITTDSENFSSYTTDEILVVNGELRIGVKNVASLTGRWFAATQFKLTYVRQLTDEEKAEIAKEDLSATITAASSARKTANEGTGVFQIPTAAGTTLASAITTAQSVYDNAGATLSDVTTAISTLNAAVATYEATTLNAPDADTHYNIIVATTGHAKFNNAVVESLGATSANNPTGYAFNASATPNVNLAQAVKFTQVSGNTYNISFETSEGVVYLTYGSLNGSAAGWATQQIQGTTDSSKKGEFKIAATATANVFNIYNTITNSTIACQTGGSLYTEAGNADFSIAETSQATVDMTISEDVKYATRIFPFTPTSWPNGVVAYSCATTEDNVLSLEEVDVPVANTPYILYAEGGSTGSVSGWGTAPSTDAKKVGLLTGVYTVTDAPVGSYVLQNNNAKVAFYLVAEGKQPTVGANRCYLTNGGSGSARSAFFFRGEITGIKAINALTSGKAQIFNASGAQIPALQKGMNIIRMEDGTTQKVMVK